MILGSGGSGLLKGVNRYQTFGLREDWLREYLSNPDQWVTVNTLGPRQFESMRVWLKEAELWDQKPLPLTAILLPLRASSDLFMWAVLWVNLSRHSHLVRWYIEHVPMGTHSIDDLVSRLAGTREPRRTERNAILALVQLLERTPIGDKLGLGRVEHTGRSRRLSKETGGGVPSMGVLYSLLRHAQDNARYGLVIREFLSSDVCTGPLAELCLSEADLRRHLLQLQEDFGGQLVRVDFAGTLDKVDLSPDLTPLGLVSHYVELLRTARGEEGLS